MIRKRTLLMSAATAPAATPAPVVARLHDAAA